MSISAYLRLVRCSAIASLMLTTACSTQPSTPVAVTPSPAATTLPEPQPSLTATPAIASKDPFASAEDKAIGAANLAQNASTVEDWALVKSKLQQAIALMKTVPANSPKRAIAQKQQAAYQQQLKVAQQQSQKLAKGNLPTPASAKPSTTGKPSKVVAEAAVPAISGRGLTAENYSRIDFGMSPDAVRSLLGTPTYEKGNPPSFAWTWESSDKKTTVSVDFNQNKVAGKTCITSSAIMRCTSKV